jgi:hypothetical protein
MRNEASLRDSLSVAAKRLNREMLHLVGDGEGLKGEHPHLAGGKGPLNRDGGDAGPVMSHSASRRVRQR